MEQPHAVVVGAGLAGLAAAHRLARNEVAVTLLERDLRIGGRVRSEWTQGFTIDACSASIFRCDPTLGALLDELELRDEMVSLCPAGREQMRGGIRHPVHAESLLGILRTPGVRPLHALRTGRLARLLRRFGANLDPDAPERAAAHDDRSVRDFCRLYFGRSALERWAAPALAAAALCDPRETSRVLLLLFATRGRLAAEPCALRSGMAALAESLAAGLEPRLGTGVERVASEGGRLAVHARGTLADASRETHRADAVVLALPAPEVLRVAAPLLSPAERDFHAAVGYDPALSLVVATGESLEREGRFIQVPEAEGWPVCAIQVEVAGPSGRVPDGCSLLRLCADAATSRAQLGAPDDAIWRHLLPTIDHVYPHARDAELVRRVFRDPRAFPRFPVGHYRALARFANAQADLRAHGRRLYFAGDHLADPSLEGALASGERAARAALRDLGMPAEARETGAAAPAHGTV